MDPRPCQLDPIPMAPALGREKRGGRRKRWVREHDKYSPNKRDTYEVVLGLSAVPNQTVAYDGQDNIACRHGLENENAPSAGFADAHAWSGEVLPQTLIVFSQSSQFELRHGLFVRSGGIHGDVLVRRMIAQAIRERGVETGRYLPSRAEVQPGKDSFDGSLMDAKTASQSDILAAQVGKRRCAPGKTNERATRGQGW